MAIDVFAGCNSQTFFGFLLESKTSFSNEAFNAIAPSARPTMTYLAMAWFAIQGINMARKGGAALDLMGKMQEKLAWIVFCSLMLAPTPSGVPLVYQYIINPMEAVSLKYAVKIAALSGVQVPASSGYTGLACTVENQMFHVIRLILSTVKGYWEATGIGFTIIVIAIMSIVLILPYLFVTAIFFAFMVEAMFKFVAVGIVTPLLVLFAPFEPLRPFAVAGMRIAFGAALTLIFAAGAMGFTVSAIDRYTSTALSDSALENAASTPAACLPGSKSGEVSVDTGGLGIDNPSIDQAACTAARKEQAATGAFRLLSNGYLLLFAIGYASILLHLAAKALASNISGANDGAGPAAAVVAGGKMALAGAAGALGTAAFGKGGLGASASTAIGTATPNLHGHGLVGGPLAALFSRGEGDSAKRDRNG